MTAIVIVSLPAASLALLTKLHAARTKPLAAPALRKRLAQHGYAAHAAVLAFEKAFGGLEVPCEETSKDWKTKNEPRWLFGAGACLRSKAHVAPRGGRSQAKLSLVPVVYSPDDYICYLDAEGHAWGHDTIEAEKAKRVARGGEELVAQLVSFIAAEHMDAGEASKAARGVSAKPLTKPKGSARGVSAKPLEEPKGYAVDWTSMVPFRPAAKHYCDWLDPKFHTDVCGVRVKVERRVGGALDVFGRGYTAEITGLVEGACIALAVSGKALGKNRVRVELRFTPEGSKTSRLSAYFWKEPKGAAVAIGDSLWESHGKKLFDAFRK